MENRLAPIYTVQSKQSNVEQITIDKYDQIASLMDGNIVMWQHHALYFGKVSNRSISWNNDSASVKEDVKHIVELRIFNEDSEVHLLRKSEQELFGRKRTDLLDGESMVKVIDSVAQLRSALATDSVAVKVRNYFEIDPSGKNQVVDMRFVEFKK